MTSDELDVLERRFLWGWGYVDYDEKKDLLSLARIGAAAVAARNHEKDRGVTETLEELTAKFLDLTDAYLASRKGE